ncbi:hypothetical protein BJX76DRAFT_302546 [Aspergillus varians]
MKTTYAIPKHRPSNLNHPRAHRATPPPTTRHASHATQLNPPTEIQIPELRLSSCCPASPGLRRPRTTRTWKPQQRSGPGQKPRDTPPPTSLGRRYPDRRNTDFNCTEIQRRRMDCLRSTYY